MSDNEPGSESPERAARKQLAFFGRISSSVSHEINNVLTSITEVAGLLEDLAAAASQGRALDPAKISKNIDTISRQTARGVSIIKTFNKFAHSTDEPVMSFDAGAMTENLCSLSRRLADIKNLKLEFVQPSSQIMMSSSPFSFQQAVFACISGALAGGERGGAISVSIEKDEPMVKVTVKIGPIAETAAVQAGLDDARAIVESMSGRFESPGAVDGNTVSVALMFPRVAEGMV